MRFGFDQPCNTERLASQPGAHFADPGEVRSTWKWAQRTVLVRAARHPMWTWGGPKMVTHAAKMSSTHQGG